MTYLRMSRGVAGLKTRPLLQPVERMSWSVRSTCGDASGWNVMYEAPASAKSWTMRSTGDTMRWTSMGAVTPCLRRAEQTMGDRQVGHVVVVHDVKVHDVRAGGQRRVDLGAELREVRRQDGGRDQEVLLGHDELHLDTRAGRARARRGQRLGDERIGRREGEGDDEGLHLFFLTIKIGDVT